MVPSRSMKINHSRGRSGPRILYKQTKKDYKQSRGKIKEWSFGEDVSIYLTRKQNGSYAEIATVVSLSEYICSMFDNVRDGFSIISISFILTHKAVVYCIVLIMVLPQ